MTPNCPTTGSTAAFSVHFPFVSYTRAVIDMSALQMWLAVLIRWSDRQEREALAYLIEENRILRAQLGGRRPRLTDDDRRRLAVRAFRLGRRALHEVAASAMSRASFARNFERALGQSPMQYLTDWRLTLARDYVLAGELTLEQIADRTGYSSPNAFAATFRRHVGLAPGQWRQQYSSQPQQVAPE
jgi:AraC-like DNA-binding protein